MRFAIPFALLATWSLTGFAGQTLTEPEQQELVERIARELRDTYVFPVVGDRIAATLELRLRGGNYRGSTEPSALARVITNDMQEIGHDKHLFLGYNGPAETRVVGALASSPIAAVTSLDGNIGYINVRGFPGPETFNRPFKHAIQKLARSTAIIIDLRTSGGGRPQSIMFAEGFFIPKRKLVARMYSRNGVSSELWTTEVIGPHFEKDLYLLIGGSTYSAPEVMAYDLKARGRATIVGEASGGGAHIAEGIPLGKGFELVVAMMRAEHAITGSDWEGTGVIPDIPVPVGHALEAAQLAALKKMPRTPQINVLITRLEKQITP